MHAPKLILCLMTALTLTTTTPAVTAASVSVTLAQNGKASLPIVIAQRDGNDMVLQKNPEPYGQRQLQLVPARQAIQTHADTLAVMLKKITGADFKVNVGGDINKSIVIGLAGDFPQLKLDDQFDLDDPMRTEDYLIQSHQGGLYLIGASDLAIQHAVWDLLHHIGYRQFFPGPNWEIIPQTSTLAINIDQFESPSYKSRLIWYGGGMQKYNNAAFTDWITRNRINAGFGLNTSHAYIDIIKRNKEAFDKDPTLYAQVDGKHPATTHAKLNVANPDLQKLVIEDSLQWFKDNPHEISKTMDPSDYGGWSNTGPSAALGEGTNQALTLNNLVAKAINQNPKQPRYVGMYAYYQHQAPPTIDIDPHVIVSFATRFIKPGMTVDELIQGWKKQGLKHVGIREYYSVFPWDWSMPDLSIQGGDLAYLTYTIPHFHQMGAQFLTSESSDSWGTIGLGHYLASRLLWDVSEAQNADDIINDFLDKSFGSASAPMARFYDLINGKDRLLLNDRMVSRMYTLLGEARSLAAGDESSLARINDLVLYTRYVELMQRYMTLKAAGLPRQDAFEDVMKFGYRIKDTYMVHVTALYARNYVQRQDKEMIIPADAQWKVAEDQNPWKSSEPFSDTDIAGFVQQGVASEKPLHFVLAKNPNASSDNTNLRVRDGVSYLIHADKPGLVSIDVNAAPVGLSWGPAYRVTDANGKTLAQGRVALDETAEVTFDAAAAGTYRLDLEPTVNNSRVESQNPVGIIASSPTFGIGYLHLYRPDGKLYFHVPQGVSKTSLQVMGQGKGEFIQATLIDASGNEVETKDMISGVEPHTFNIQRAAGAPGETWTIEFKRPSSGYYEDAYLLMGKELPPVISTSANAVFELAH